MLAFFMPTVMLREHFLAQMLLGARATPLARRAWARLARGRADAQVANTETLGPSIAVRRWLDCRVFICKQF